MNVLCHTFMLIKLIHTSISVVLSYFKNVERSSELNMTNTPSPTTNRKAQNNLDRMWV